MRKITLLFLAMILPLGIMAQELPVDFESPEDDAFVPFNGATANVVVDPTDATNNVLELTSNGVDFDGATLTMGTYIDLSDDNNNTITLEFWSPDATTRTHLFQLKGGTGASPQAQLYFDTTMMGWQTITLNFSDFGPTLSSDYFLMDIFADAGPGNTATGTYYIDDIDGPNGAVVPVDPVPATAAPVPSYPDAEVYAIYNDTNGYTTSFTFDYGFGSTQGEPDLDNSATENKAYKFNFGLDGFGQGLNDSVDISAYNYVTFDYWAGPGLTGFDVVMINPPEYAYQIGVDEPIVTETWTKVEIPMSFFTNAGFNDAAFLQWKMGPLNNSVDNAGVAYIDNILLTQNSLSTNNPELTNFSAYPNPTTDAWAIETNNTNVQTVDIFNTLGRLVKSVDVNDSKVTIDASDLSSGIYFARINSQGSNPSTIKLIKQ